MIAVVAPEPVPWLAFAIELARAEGDDVQVLAPWALRDRLAWRVAAGRLDFARRRMAPDTAGARLSAQPGWPLAELALSAWIGQRADRRLRALFWRRAAVDRLAARWLAGRSDLCGVIAPAGAAERSFAVAAERGARRVLLEDLPGLRQLQEDLDRAAAAHPDCRFLRRYRAPLAVVARQESEWALADQLVLRGRFAHEVRLRAGVPVDRLAAWPARHPPAAPRGGALPGRRVLLAGLAAARHGTAEALALLRARDRIELVLRIGEGFEPRELAAHPRAIAARGDPLAGVDLVIAPAWCESYPAELARAAGLGIPIVATRRAAADLDVHLIDPGDVGGLIAAADRLLSPTPATLPACGS
ncbi:MAG TPA: hypothetical protein VNO33_08570 [Kofleriaceae bacterium]|nr:hypothetical protein [Kofleriaceae bacterium]